ncbi:MAG: chromosomal replication initiator protein DnaA [Kiritimatiellae bacterium]|nr:chromosomal replication initiator protein DnaA [Kiritimatiellia bacterium]
MGEHEALWAQACEELRRRVSPEVFERWIAVIRATALEGDTLVLSVPCDFYVGWLEENYLPLIRTALTAVAARDVPVRLCVDSPAPEPAAPKPPPAAEPARQAPRGSISTPLDEAFTFETFVLGPSNAFAHAACLAVAQTPGRAYNPLLIFGGSGLGKTHLMQAVGHYALKTSRTITVCYTSAEAFLNEYIESLQYNRMVHFRRKYRGVDLLLIDDIHFLAGRDGLQEEFFHMFNELHTRGRQIVLTCDRAPAEIQGLDKRLVSRFAWGVTTQIEPPDVETRVAILRRKAELMRAAVPDEVILFIAEHVRSNIRTMEGALKSVWAYAALHHQTPSVEMATRVLRGHIEASASAPPTIEAIQKAVAQYYDVRLSDMTSQRRMQSVVVPRQVAMYLCRLLTGQSLPAIGEAFGRNHATVLHACRTVSERARHDPNLADTIATLRRRLGAD